MVQEAMPAPVVDLTASSDPAADRAYSEVKPSAGASVAPKDDDSDHWEGESLYEEILDEVEAFEYSSSGMRDHHAPLHNTFAAITH